MIQLMNRADIFRINSLHTKAFKEWRLFVEWNQKLNAKADEMAKKWCLKVCNILETMASSYACSSRNEVRTYRYRTRNERKSE